MAQVRFLDQVPVGVYNPNGSGNGGAGTIDIYQNGILVSASVPYINISGSATVQGFAPLGINNGVTVVVQGVGFPFSGSAVITGSLIISGSSQPIIIQTLPYDATPNKVVTYNTSSGVLSYSNFPTSGTSGNSGSDRKSTRLNSSHSQQSRMPSSA